MSVIGPTSGVNQLQRMDSTQAVGEIGGHRVEQIENSRAEPRETSIGSKIKAFFKGIGEIFSNLKAEWKEAQAAKAEEKAAKAEAKAERKIGLLGVAFGANIGHGVADSRKLLQNFEQMMDKATAKHGMKEGAKQAISYTLANLEYLPEGAQANAKDRLKNLSAPGGLSEQLTNRFETQLQKNVEFEARARMAQLPGFTPDPLSPEERRANFAEKLSAFEDKLAQVYPRYQAFEENKKLNGGTATGVE